MYAPEIANSVGRVYKTSREARPRIAFPVKRGVWRPAG